MRKTTCVQLGGHKSLILNKTLIQHIDVLHGHKSLKYNNKKVCVIVAPKGGSVVTHPPRDMAPNLLLGGAI